MAQTSTKLRSAVDTHIDTGHLYCVSGIETMNPQMIYKIILISTTIGWSHTTTLEIYRPHDMYSLMHANMLLL